MKFLPTPAARLGALSLALALAMVGCGSGDEPSAAPDDDVVATETADDDATATEPPEPTAGGEELIDVSLAAFRASFVNYPVYVALSEGFFEENGCSVDVTYASGADVITSVVAGAVDFGAPALEHAVNLRDEGRPVKIIAQNQSLTPFTVIVSEDVPTPNEDAPYPEMLKDLEGLKLGVSSLGAGTDRTLRFLLEEAGLNPDTDVTITPVGGPDTQLPALEQGTIDGTMAFEPIQSQAIHGIGGFKPVLDMQGGEGPDMFKEYAYNGIVTLEETIEENPEAVECMASAIAEAGAFINDEGNLDRLVEIAEEHVGLEPDVLRPYLEQYAGIFTPNVSQQGYENMNEFMLMIGEIEEPVPYSEVVAEEYMPAPLD